MSGIRIEGAKKLERGFDRLIRYVDHGIVGTMLKAVLMLHRYASMVVHVVTGRLRNSLTPVVEERGNSLVGAVETNLNYAPFEFNRPGVGSNNALGRATPHNALVYTHAQKGAEVTQIFANELNHQVSLASRI